MLLVANGQSTQKDHVGVPDCTPTSKDQDQQRDERAARGSRHGLTRQSYREQIGEKLMNPILRTCSTLTFSFEAGFETHVLGPWQSGRPSREGPGTARASRVAARRAARLVRLTAPRAPWTNAILRR